MTYQEHIQQELKESPAFSSIVERLKLKRWRNILIFADDDPDGGTAAAILIRTLLRLGITYSIDLPAPFELEGFRVKEWTDRNKFDAIFCIDKGTCGYYDDFVVPGRDFVVIDHHLFQGDPKKCVVYNPKKPCCTAYLCHRIMTALGFRTDFDDFVALVGLRSDWSIRPHVTAVADYIAPFYDEASKKFPRLLVRNQARPTWMEIDQREWTLVLNQIAELSFAVTGGGFQYWYGDRDPSLKDRHPPTLHLNALLKLGQDGMPLSSIESLDDFFRFLPDEKIIRRMYDWYLKDWEAGSSYLDNAFCVKKIGPVSLYFYVGGDIPLLPMIGSVKLGEMVKKRKDEAAILIMAVQLKNGWTHFSMRGTSEKIHVGKICSNLAAKLVARHGFKDEITGGGHPQAAECKIRRPEISFFSNLSELGLYLSKLESLDVSAAAGKIAPADRTYAVDLGLTYLSG